MTQPSEMPGVANCAVSETGRTLNIHTGIWKPSKFYFSPRRSDSFVSAAHATACASIRRTDWRCIPLWADRLGRLAGATLKEFLSSNNQALVKCGGGVRRSAACQNVHLVHNRAHGRRGLFWPAIDLEPSFVETLAR